MKKILTTALAAFAALSFEASAQPAVSFQDTAPQRNEFISYSIRDNAVNRNRSSEPYVIELKNLKTTYGDNSTVYEAVVQIPEIWSERDIYLHLEGSRNSHAVYVNGIFAGSARDSRLPSEFEISRLVKDRSNTISIEVFNDNPEPEGALVHDARPQIATAFLHVQPRVKIFDYDITANLDSLGQYGLLRIDITVSNGFNAEEPVAVGFDLYSPEGDLKEYMLREIVIDKNSTQVVSMETQVWGAPKRLWSAENPQVYDVMIFLRRGKFYTEYIPVRVGFGETHFNGKTIVRNGKAIDIRPVSYNAEATQKDTEKSITAFKKSGYNTIYVDYPQPIWFYDICDKKGMYVVDQANINTSREGRRLSNDPQWLDEYMGRADGMYHRTRNHVCIIGRSIGGDSGNGYNMYKVYQWLKEQTPDQAVVYRHSENQWNNDLDMPVPSVR